LEKLDNILEQELESLRLHQQMLARLAAKFDLTVNEVNARLDDEEPGDAYAFVQAKGLGEEYFSWIIKGEL